jgi:hypothetical protein
MTYQARILRPGEERAWGDLALAHGSLFNTLKWTALAGDRLVRCGIFNKGGRMEGGFCFYRDRRAGLPFVRNAPYTPECGPFLDNPASNPVGRLEAERDALEAMAEFFDRLPWAVLSLSLNRAAGDALPFQWRHYKVIPCYTYRLDLRSPWEEILREMSAGRRNDMRKAEKDGLKAVPVTDFRTVGALVRETFDRQAMRADERTVAAILEGYARPDNSFAFATLLRGEPCACSFCVHDGRTAYYLMGGYRTGKTHHGAGALCLGRAIQHARDLGLAVFDFEGSMVPPIERFFRGFGGRYTPYLTVNKAWLPLEMALKLVRRSAF